MSFLEEVKKTILEDYNDSYTENGAKGYKTTGKNLLDMSFKIPSYRNCTSDTIYEDFSKAANEDFGLAIKWLFYVRDIRGGLGERKIFREIMLKLSNNFNSLCVELLHLIPEYGRWDDLIYILLYTVNSKVQKECIKIIKNQLEFDLRGSRNDKPISLLAKWLPSINTSSEVTVAEAKKLANWLGLSEKVYRKTLSHLRKYLNVVETKMSANNWNDVKYENVPSKANLLYADAFMKHDRDRRTEYLKLLSENKTTINSGTLYPHEIVHKYGHEYSETLEAMWKELPNIETPESTIVVADGSASMRSFVDSRSKVTALEIANALAIYFAERCRDEFKDKYITFSETPQLVNLGNAKCLKDKIQTALSYNEVANTNIERVFNLILKVAVGNKMKQEDIPANILIISDMEFDNAIYNPINPKLFKKLQEQYRYYGYYLPKLIFWNVNSRTNTIPLIQNDAGVILMSGFSVNNMNIVLSGELDPYKALVKVLNSTRYDKVSVALNKYFEESGRL